jgi:hypothetical protein
MTLPGMTLPGMTLPRTRSPAGCSPVEVAPSCSGLVCEPCPEPCPGPCSEFCSEPCPELCPEALSRTLLRSRRRRGLRVLSRTQRCPAQRDQCQNCNSQFELMDHQCLNFNPSHTSRSWSQQKRTPAVSRLERSPSQPEFRVMQPRRRLLPECKATRCNYRRPPDYTAAVLQCMRLP